MNTPLSLTFPQFIAEAAVRSGFSVISFSAHNPRAGVNVGLTINTHRHCL